MGKTTISDYLIFTHLFKNVYQKCFGNLLAKVLTESECKHLSNEIEEKTGLVIGWKSLKNYAQSIIEENNTKQVNPSLATLDTLSRYVFEVEPISEIERKYSGNPYLYWFRFRDQFLEKKVIKYPSTIYSLKKISIGVILLVLSIAAINIFISTKNYNIDENFLNLDTQFLVDNGWHILSKNDDYWERRWENQDKLTLYTVKGDSWRTKELPPDIQNLLCRELPKDNYSAELHFSDFIPLENWQQAGLILMEDTLFRGKYIRISIGYNDNFGGIKKPGEISVFGVASKGINYTTVEEVLFHLIFKLDSNVNHEIIEHNLTYSALKVEKKGNNLRFLSAASSFENFPFKEIKNIEIDMNPQFIGIYACKGFFADSAQVIPVKISKFKLENLISD